VNELSTYTLGHIVHIITSRKVSLLCCFSNLTKCLFVLTDALSLLIYWCILALLQKCVSVLSGIWNSFLYICEQDILKDAQENNLTCVTEMPYFEGDFWPNILEESIKEVEQEELEKRRREEEEAAADTDDGEPSVHGDRVEVG